ncbi:MAG: flavin reductase family protein [Sulfurovum sp.]|nr:flavin reductase family protein [Sulfurovum sp.]
MNFNLNENKTVNEIYKLMSQTIIPRPIAWVITEDDGVVNIAPFSYFIGLSSEPATVLISVGHKADGSEKDTLLNIRKYEKCTICMVQESDLEKMHFSSKSLNHDASESEYFNIETINDDQMFPPRIATAPVAYYCTLNQEIDLEGSATVPLVLNVEKIFVDDDIITNKETLSIKFQPIARIGKSYAFLGEDVDAPQIP